MTGSKSTGRAAPCCKSKKKKAQPVRLLAGLGHHDLVAGQQPNPLRPVYMLLDELPAQRRPIDFFLEKTLHRPVAPALFGPAGQAQHRDSPGHRQHGLDDDGELVQGAPVQVWTQSA